MTQVGAYNYEICSGGRLKHFYSAWLQITNDPVILQICAGLRLEFESDVLQTRPAFPIKMNKHEEIAVGQEIAKLQGKGVIQSSTHEPGEFISNIFTRPKKDGSFRMILNLKDLNTNLTYHHFKMDTFLSASKLVTKHCFMASIDLKDAYYSVPIHDQDQKYLKFMWKGQLYKFKVLPNGLSSGPRMFTKLLKPVLALLRMQGHIIVSYIDDTLLVGRTESELDLAVKETIELFESLGFIINREKSVFKPSQEAVFLGFVLNSVMMTVRLTERKIQDLKASCTALLRAKIVQIQEVASLLGKLVAAFPACRYGPLHYRELEKDKIAALKFSKGNFAAPITIGPKARAEITWWIHNIEHCYGSFDVGVPQMVIQTDASGRGWGAYNGIEKIGGRWNASESIRAHENQINYLEMLAVFHALRSLCSEMRKVTIKLEVDNTTAVAYLNHMGGIKSESCNDLAIEIWEYCRLRDIWLIAVHLPGVQNTVADRLSRQFDDSLEWKLDSGVFKRICSKFGTPDIDLFASRLNTQLDRYVSWKPDPGAEATDALSFLWTPHFFYAFPPFCLINHCLQKIIAEQAEGIMVVPLWPTQPWYSRLPSLMTEAPILLPSRNILHNAVTGDAHPMTKLRLMCCRLSGKAYSMALVETYPRTPWESSCQRGGRALKDNIAHITKNGLAFVNRQAVIRFTHL